MPGAAGNAAAPTARCMNARRGNFMMLLQRHGADVLREQTTAVLRAGGRGLCLLAHGVIPLRSGIRRDRELADSDSPSARQNLWVHGLAERFLPRAAGRGLRIFG